MTAILALLLTLAVAPADDPPTFKGHTPEEWANDLRHSKPDVRAAALEALRTLGPKAKDAVPEIVSAIEKWKDDGGFVMGAAEVVAVIRGPRADVTRPALFALTMRCRTPLLPSSKYLSEHTPGVVKDLIELCGDKDAKVREAAAKVLGDLKNKRGKDDPTLYAKAGDAAKGVPAALLKLLDDPERAVKFAAADAIHNVAPEEAKKVIPMVVEVLRKAAAAYPQWEINALSPVAEDAAKVLIPLLADPEPWARTSFLSVLCRLPVVPQLAKALKEDPNPVIRTGAAHTLSDRTEAEAAAALTAALTDADAEVRFAAAEALTHTDRTSAAPIPVLVDALKNGQGNKRRFAAWTLSRLGPVAKPAVPPLSDALADADADVRMAAALALVEIDPKAAEAGVPVIREVLKSKHATLGAKAAAKLGPAAKAALPELRALYTADAHNRVLAAAAAGRVDPAEAEKAAEILVGVIRGARSKGNNERMNAIRGLRDIGPAAKSAVPALLDVMNAAGPFRPAAAVAVVRIDPDGGKAAVEWLRSRFDPKSEEFDEVVEAAPEMGPAAKLFLPELRGMLKTDFGRTAAAKALGGLGADAADALPELRELLNTEKGKRESAALADAIRAIEKK